jgi:hypothetical protein
MQREQLANMYLEYLKSEGYCPHLDDDGDVVFKYEGRHYAILIDPKDAGYFRLVFPNFWAIEDEESRYRAIVAAHHATSRVKVAKVFVVRDDTWVSIELFCSPPQVFQDVFERALGAIQAAVKAFLEQIHEIETDEADEED